MKDLTTLLDRAAGPLPAVDLESDLARGRRALTRRRRRLAAVSLVGAAAASVLTVAIVPPVLDQLAARPAADPASAPSSPSVTTAGPFTFAGPPEGWSVQGSRSSGVTFEPDAGGVDDHPDSYVGKLVFYLEAHKQRGDHTTYEGRDFWVRHSSDEAPDPESSVPVVDPDDPSGAPEQEADLPESHGAYTMISTGIPGRDSGSLTLQYPDSTGFTEEQMVAFLASVEVGPAAELSYG